MKYYYVYVLHNPVNGFVYIGFSSNLKQRINYHNAGRVKSTKHYLPLTLVFYEAYIKKSDAMRREKYLKTSRGKTTLKTRLKDYFSDV
ncbi:GIY-YIG nuclease family protein [candidate division WWE3 bacterium]|uniref:GIY-YIG nuclease family protein n=1 Tax=candidate division WWE3 bacterium TaxID=2053526 RepID=A0A955LLC4_UNCKA|nr:GIY-YIG nuclease family protein [candidate division WWE3 bacterium]